MSEQGYDDGYKYRIDRLELQLDQWREAVREKAPEFRTTERQRQVVHDIAVGASRSVAVEYIAPSSALHREFNTGQRDAIRDWSHEHNHEIRLKQAEELSLRPRMSMSV